jgi:hypothetical protein
MRILASDVDSEFELIPESIVTEPPPAEPQSTSSNPFKNPFTPINFDVPPSTPPLPITQRSPVNRKVSFKAAAPDPRRLASTLTTVKDPSRLSVRLKEIGGIFTQPFSFDIDNEAAPVEQPPCDNFLQSLPSESTLVSRAKQITISVETKSDSHIFRNLLVDLLTDCVPQCINTALSRLPKDRRVFTEASQHWEGELLYLWIHAAVQQPLMEYL